MDEAITNVASNTRPASDPRKQDAGAISASSRKIAFALIKDADSRVHTEDGADETIILTPHAAPRAVSVRGGGASTPRWAVALTALLVLLPVAGIWMIWPVSPPDPPTPPGAAQTINPAPAKSGISAVSVSPNSVSQVPASQLPVAQLPVSPGLVQPERATPPPEPKSHGHSFVIETASEQQIVNHAPAEAASGLTVFQFAPNPRVLVLDFNSLRGQGRMLNRTAALVEKLGLPHDRLLSDAELDTAIQASGSSAETFYFGHDYGAASLRRFFALADRDHVRLSNDEDILRQIMQQVGWSEPTSRGALLSIPQADPNQHITLPERATILHHELSHGEYFTNPAYAAFVHKFWTQTLTESERDRIRDRLHALGYDPAIDELMENEAQAYLMFTESKEFFTPAMFGISDSRLTDLRNGFFRAMPAGWLRDSLGHSLKAQSPNSDRAAGKPKSGNEPRAAAHP